MAGETDGRTALFPGMPPVVTLVYAEEGGGFESSGDWSRIAGELRQQEREREKEKEKETDSDKDEAKKEESSSDTKFFRVELVNPLFPLEPREDDDEPIRWLFPLSAKSLRSAAAAGSPLDRKMADEIASLYSLHGIDKVDDLGGSLFTAYEDALAAFAAEYADGTREAKEQFDHGPDVRTAYETVHAVWRRHADALRDRIKEHQRLVAEAAAKVARAKLEEAALEILTEAARYLGPLQTRRTVNAQKLLETISDPLNVRLDGPGYPALIEAVARIESRIAAVEHPAPAPPAPLAKLNPLATSPVVDAANALGLELSQACQRFPVLHHTWQTLRFTERAAPPGAGAQLDTITAVHGVLRKAWTANRRLHDRFASERDLVWLFPPLVHETLEQLAQEDPDYGDLGEGARAAQERLEESEDRATQQLALVVGFLEMAVALTSPAPPVALCFAGASLVFSLLDTVFEYQELSAQDDAAHAVLDPSKALSADPSYFFFALGIATSLLDLRSIRDAYRAARVAREVDELGNLVEEGV
jgi:hypothetical protein